MSTAEQIAVPDYIRENKCRFRNGKSAEVFISAQGGIVAAGAGYLGIQNPDGSAIGDHREYDLVPVAEERPRGWEIAISRGDGSARVVEPGDRAPSKLAWEVVRVTELPEGWEAINKKALAEKLCALLPGGTQCDPQDVADRIRAFLAGDEPAGRPVEGGEG